MTDRHLRAVPPTPPAPALDVPRGRLISAEGIVRRWYLDAETNEPMVDPRWVRENMPYKQSLSHSRVAWYDLDVEAIIVEARRSGVKIKDVKLDYLERKGRLMKLILQSTAEFVVVRGARCRVWHGTTESGIGVYAMVARVAVAVGDDQTEFEREFETESHEPVAIDLRMLQ